MKTLEIIILIILFILFVNKLTFNIMFDIVNHKLIIYYWKIERFKRTQRMRITI